MVRYLASLLSLILLLGAANASAQGFPIDSLRGRINDLFGSDWPLRELHSLIPASGSQRVWGFAAGDFSNDGTPDLAISLYDNTINKRQTRIHFFENREGHLVKVAEKLVPYVESPIEIGLAIDKSVMSITQKLGDQHWFQEGFTVADGDVILVERFETEREETKGTKARSIGKEIYRNYETLLTREAYFTGATDNPVFSNRFYTVPAYNRLRAVYPGYGLEVFDTSSEFIRSGASLRRDRRDLSIRSLLAAYDDESIYVSINVADDAIYGGSTSGDQVTLWFDTKVGPERHIKSRRGGVTTYRTTVDSLIYGLTFSIPTGGAGDARITEARGNVLNNAQRSAASGIRARVMQDTVNGALRGYILRVRIPITYLGFEINPVSVYESRIPDPIAVRETEQTPITPSVENEAEESAAIGFTAVVDDVDDPQRPSEVTRWASSDFVEGNPGSIGTMLLMPTRKLYGQVTPTYLDRLILGLKQAGY